MTFRVRHGVTYLLLVAVLLAILVVPVLGATSSQTIITNEPNIAAPFENVETTTDPATAIACSCPDPGGSNSGCC
jgi:hypothetical protein